MKRREKLTEHINAADAARQLLDTRRGIYFQQQHGFVRKLAKIVFSENGQLGWQHTKDPQRGQAVIDRFHDYQLGMAELAAAALIQDIDQSTQSEMPELAAASQSGLPERLLALDEPGSVVEDPSQ